MTTRDELDVVNEAFAALLATPDPGRLAAFYTDDAVFLEAGKATTIGRAAILEKFRRDLPEPMSVRFETGEVIEDGDLVVDIGTLHSGGKRFARYVVVYRRQEDGTLKLAVDVPLRAN